MGFRKMGDTYQYAPIYAVGNTYCCDVLIPQDSVYTFPEHYLKVYYERHGDLLIQPETRDTIWVVEGGAQLMAILCLAQNQRIVLQRRKRTMKNYLLPIFVLLIVGCGNRNPANIVVENRIRQTEQTDSIIGDSYERDTIQGDFNGDGKIEYAYSESNPAEYYSLDEVDDGKLNNITFSNPTIPAIETEFQIERLTNEGDLNGDGTDEIGFIERAVSRFVFYKVYSVRKGVWKQIVSVYTHDAFFDPINGDAPDLVRIAPNKTGYVIVQTIEWDDETEWHKGVEKSVKIK